MVRRALAQAPGGDFGYLPVGHEGQAREDVAQIRVGIDPAPPAVLTDRADDRTASSRPGVADEEPVFLADGRGPNGIFYVEMRIMLRRGRGSQGSPRFIGAVGGRYLA